MMELLETAPRIAVDPAEYARLLGYPRNHVFSGRAAELSQWAAAWYAQNGRPWIYARQCHSFEIRDTLVLDGQTFSSPRLLQTLTSARANSAFLVAVSAGPETEAYAQRLWREQKPDEYFFLEIFGSAVVEHLVTLAGAHLCAWADQNGLAVLPHYSPGYPEWDIAQQPQLLELITSGAARPFPSPLSVFDTGMLRPKKSLLAVFGLTPDTAQTSRLTTLVPCHHCSYSPCQFRRAPYRRRGVADAEVAAAGSAEISAAPSPLASNARYTVGVRALERWARDRLTMTPGPDGTLDAVFRYDGTTCSNMGRPLAFLYHMRIGPRAEGFPLREMRCMPAPGDEGHRFMCRYLSHGERLLATIEEEKPLLSRQLRDVFDWDRPGAGPGCYCEVASRQHKWGLALETLHYALAREEKPT